MLPRNWGRSLGLLWVPAVIAVISIELWLGVPPVGVWLSLAGLLAAFVLVARWIDRRRD